MSTSFLHKKNFLTLLLVSCFSRNWWYIYSRQATFWKLHLNHLQPLYKSGKQQLYGVLVWDNNTNAKSLSCHLRHFIQKNDFSFVKLLPTCPGNFGLNVNWIFMALYKKHIAQAIDNACINNIAFIYFFFQLNSWQAANWTDLVSQWGIKHLICRYKN